MEFTSKGILVEKLGVRIRRGVTKSAVRDNEASEKCATARRARVSGAVMSPRVAEAWLKKSSLIEAFERKKKKGFYRLKRCLDVDQKAKTHK